MLDGYIAIERFFTKPINTIFMISLNSQYVRGVFCLLLFVCSFSMINAQDAEKTAAGLYNEGLALLKAKNYADGLGILEQALAKATTDGNEQVIGLSKKNGAMAAYNLGKSKLTAKANDEAAALFAKGMELNPEYSSNYIGAARAMDAKGDKTGALKAFLGAADKATASGNEKKVDEAYKRGKSVLTSMYNAKSYDQVVSLGKEFLAKSPNADVNYYVGKSLMATDGHADAVSFFDAALAANPSKKDRVIYAKAQSLEKLGKNADAVAAYKLITDEKYKANAAHKVSTLQK